MQSLAKALQEKKSEFKEFEIIARKVLNYIPNVLSGYKEKMAIEFIHQKLQARLNLSDL